MFNKYEDMLLRVIKNRRNKGEDLETIMNSYTKLSQSAKERLLAYVEDN